SRHDAGTGADVRLLHRHACGGPGAEELTGCAASPPYCSTLMLASLATFAHFAISLRMKAANSAGVEETVSRPAAANFSFSSGCASAAFSACDSFTTASGGVPAGA